MIRLIYAGKSLADEQNIAHYNMKAGDTIHMLLQLKGGFWVNDWIDLYIVMHEIIAATFA